MKSASIFLFVLFSLNLLSCKQKKDDKVFILFNEGVSLSLEAGQQQEKGNFVKATELNRKSIEKFKKVLELDSSHISVRSALGHTLYIDKQFKDAIFWFEQANTTNGDFTANYREMGLSKINLGLIKEGKADIDKAFNLDKSSEIRQITIDDLIDIGTLAFSYGDDYIKKGETEKGNDYREFSLDVLSLAFKYDSSRTDISLKIANYAHQIGNTEVENKYKKLSAK